MSQTFVSMRNFSEAESPDRLLIIDRSRKIGHCKGKSLDNRIRNSRHPQTRETTEGGTSRLFERREKQEPFENKLRKVSASAELEIFNSVFGFRL